MEVLFSRQGLRLNTWIFVAMDCRPRHTWLGSGDDRPITWSRSDTVLEALRLVQVEFCARLVNHYPFPVHNIRPTALCHVSCTVWAVLVAPSEVKQGVLVPTGDDLGTEGKRSACILAVPPAPTNKWSDIGNRSIMQCWPVQPFIGFAKPTQANLGQARSGRAFASNGPEAICGYALGIP
jgi:hypothetical protein